MRISGIVIKGKGKGKELGFPTVNILIRNEIDSGVYRGKAFIDGREYKAGIFVGKDKKLLEAHLLGFSGNLYGQEIEIEIQSKIREVINFKNDSELKKQIKKDIRRIK